MHVFKDDVMDADVNKNATLNAIRTLYGRCCHFERRSVSSDSDEDVILIQ